MASATLKKTDMRHNMRQDPKELAAQYRLSVQPRKRSVNLIKRARSRKSKDQGGSSAGITEPVVPPALAQPSSAQAEGQVNPSANTAMYIQTTSWAKLDDINDEEFFFEVDDEDYDTPEPKEEPYCQKKYRAVCQLLRCRPIKHFLRSLVKESVAIKNQKLSRDDIKACVIALMHTDSVDTLWFDNNGLGVHGATKIMDILPKKHEFTEINLTNNRLCSEGARIVCEAVMHNSYVRRLDLSGNEFSDDDADLFRQLLEENLALRSLNLSHNNFREKGGQILAQGLAKNRTLQKLDLGWNHLRMAGAVAIGKSLVENCDLEDLNLAWNGFHLRGCMALGDALAHNNSLTRLDISSNRISEIALAQLLKGLQSNTTLEKLLLPMNPLSPHAAYKLLEFVDRNEALALTFIDLGTTCVYEKFETYLEELTARRDITVIRGPVLRTGLKFEDPLASDDADEDCGDNPLIILMEYCRLQNLRLVDMFRSLDTDGSKSLSYTEFKEGMKKVNIPLSDQSVERLMLMLDLDGDGEIDFQELIQGQKEYKEMLKQAMASEGAFDQTAIARIGLRMKEKFHKRFLMRKF